MNLIHRLIEHGHLIAVASRYPDLYELDREKADDFAGSLMVSWWTARKYAGDVKDAQQNLLQLEPALTTLLNAEAERRFPTKYAVGGQSREEAVGEVYDYFWTISSLKFTAHLNIKQLEGVRRNLTQMELASRPLTDN